jgi:hypothetical protein
MHRFPGLRSEEPLFAPGELPLAWQPLFDGILATSIPPQMNRRTFSTNHQPQIQRKKKMADLNGYNANDYEDDFMDFEPIPAGKYPMAITASDLKPTKAGDGSYIELEHLVLMVSSRAAKCGTVCASSTPRSRPDHRTRKAFQYMQSSGCDLAAGFLRTA